MRYARTLILLAFLALFIVGVYYTAVYFKNLFGTNIDATTEARAQFVDTTNPNELVPDPVPLPARDRKLQKDNERKMLLYFSTTYYI